MQYFTEIIAKARTLKPTLALLQDLQVNYVHAEVYNNLEVILGNMPTLKPDDAYQSVVINNEGGTCRNLNLAFYHILQVIGFEVYLVAPFVHHYNKSKLDYDRPTHLAIIAKVGGEMYVVDPSWGNAPRYPIPYSGEVVVHPMGSYRSIIENGEIAVQKKFESWITQYTFNSSETKEYPEFQRLMEFIYSNDSMYRKHLFVTKPAPEYCIELCDDQLNTTFADGHVTHESVRSCGGLRVILMRRFGLSAKYVEEVEWVKDKILEEAYSKLAPIWGP